MKSFTRYFPQTLLVAALLTPLIGAHAATILPVGPITFSTNASYDSAFKEDAATAGILRSVGGFVQLQGPTVGLAVYDTSATGGANGSGGTAGSDANNDLSNFTISADFSSNDIGFFGIGFLLRLNAAESNGYYAAVVRTGPSSVTFDLTEGASLADGPGNNIFSQSVILTSQTINANQTYPFKLTVIGGNFAFDFGSGAATASFTDNTVSATTGQVGFSLATATPSSVTRLDNFAIGAVPEPSAALLVVVGAAGWTLRRHRGGEEKA
jgi:hypothetical protein